MPQRVLSSPPGQIPEYAPELGRTTVCSQLGLKFEIEYV